MLREFIDTYRDAIIVKAREKLTARPWPSATDLELDSGVPLFLTQLSDILQDEGAGNPSSSAAMREAATSHGRDLLALGFSVSQVVHDYGDICQAVTEMALQQNAPITTAEFHTLNRCLDAAIAEAVTEHARITAQSRSADEADRAGKVARETRDLVETAMLAFDALKRGIVAINGSTGAVLARSLLGLRELVDNTLADIRMTSNGERREPLVLAPFLEAIAMAGRLHAESREVQVTVERMDPALTFRGDPQLLSSAVSNLLNNAYKFTRPGGRVVLRLQSEDHRLQIEVEDECGGIAETEGDPFQSRAQGGGRDPGGLGLGLTIARKAVRAHGGDVCIRNIPGKGCVFVIDLPLAKDEVQAAP
jgi:signal transduction histidine kinase